MVTTHPPKEKANGQTAVRKVCDIRNDGLSVVKPLSKKVKAIPRYTKIGNGVFKDNFLPFRD